MCRECLVILSTHIVSDVEATATVVSTWLYNNTRGSLLVAVIYPMWFDAVACKITLRRHPRQAGISKQIARFETADHVFSGVDTIAISCSATIAPHWDTV